MKNKTVNDKVIRAICTALSTAMVITPVVSEISMVTAYADEAEESKEDTKEESKEETKEEKAAENNEKSESEESKEESKEETKEESKESEAKDNSVETETASPEVQAAGDDYKVEVKDENDSNKTEKSNEEKYSDAIDCVNGAQYADEAADSKHQEVLDDISKLDSELTATIDDESDKTVVEEAEAIASALKESMNSQEEKAKEIVDGIDFTKIDKTNASTVVEKYNEVVQIQQEAKQEYDEQVAQYNKILEKYDEAAKDLANAQAVYDALAAIANDEAAYAKTKLDEAKTWLALVEAAAAQAEQEVTDAKDNLDEANQDLVKSSKEVVEAVTGTGDDAKEESETKEEKTFDVAAAKKAVEDAEAEVKRLEALKGTYEAQNKANKAEAEAKLAAVEAKLADAESDLADAKASLDKITDHAKSLLTENSKAALANDTYKKSNGTTASVATADNAYTTDVRVFVYAAPYGAKAAEDLNNYNGKAKTLFTSQVDTAKINLVNPSGTTKEKANISYSDEGYDLQVFYDPETYQPAFKMTVKINGETKTVDVASKYIIPYVLKYESDGYHYDCYIDASFWEEELGLDGSQTVDIVSTKTMTDDEKEEVDAPKDPKEDPKEDPKDEPDVDDEIKKEKKKQETPDDEKEETLAPETPSTPEKKEESKKKTTTEKKEEKKSKKSSDDTYSATPAATADYTEVPEAAVEVLGETAAPEAGVLGELAAPEAGVLGELEAPETGDDSMAGFYYAMMASGAALAAAGYALSKRKEEE